MLPNEKFVKDGKALKQYLAISFSFPYFSLSPHPFLSSSPEQGISFQFIEFSSIFLFFFSLSN
jgi:hypothetical protein